MAAIALLFLGGCAERAAPQTPQLWQLTGAITTVKDSTIQIRHKSGQIVVVTVDDRTAYVRNKQRASRDQLQPGTRVRVDIVRQNAVDHAVLVRIFGGARLTSSH